MWAATAAYIIRTFASLHLDIIVQDVASEDVALGEERADVWVCRVGGRRNVGIKLEEWLAAV